MQLKRETAPTGGQHTAYWRPSLMRHGTVFLSMYARYDAPRREEASWDEMAYQRKQVNVRLQEGATGEMQVPGLRC